MRYAGVVLLWVLAPAAVGQHIRLTPGVARRFSIPPQSQPFVLTGITVAAPGGVSRLTIDLESEVLSHDLSLWARFDRDVVVQFGAVMAADFSVQTIGVGREQLVIHPGLSPPLQTGVYYLAIGVATLNTAISGSIRATLEGGGANGTAIVSTFDFDTEGWSRNFPDSSLPGASLGDQASLLEYSSAGGDPGGFLRLIDQIEERQDYAVAPPRFLGNLAAMTNPRLEFDFRHVSGAASTVQLRLAILGGGTVFQWVSEEPPLLSWQHFRIPLNAAGLQRASGLASLSQVLSNVQRIEISMDQGVGPEINGLDNFALIGDVPLGPPSAIPAAPAVSGFDADSDGWGLNYPPTAIRGASIGDSASTVAWSVTGGQPGGLLEHREANGPQDDFFVAPPKFLGNLAGIPNPRLEFDYRHASTTPVLAPVVVRLAGAGASFLWVGAIPLPFNAYQHYRIPLGADFFVRESGAASFAQALAAVERLEISAEQSTAGEVNGLDNVMLLSAPAPPARPNLTLDPSRLIFTATAGGSNPTQQSLRIGLSGDGGPLNWTATVDAASPWLRLAAASGVTPSSFLVGVNIAGLARGSYRGTITVAATGAANTPQPVTVELAVAASTASLPRVDAGGVTNAASFRGPLAAGTLASAFGQNLGPAEGASTAFQPGTQTLPTRFRSVRVLVRDSGGAQIAEAPLLYVSSRQINFQMPFEAAGRGSVQVLVDNDGLLSEAEPVALGPAAPGLFTYGANRAVVQNQDFRLNTPENPAQRGSVIIAYVTGAGPVSPPVPTGQAAPAAPLSTAAAGAVASIGGLSATVHFLGLTPGLVGLAQANIQVSESTPAGEQTLLLLIGGQAANGAIVSIR